ncbi:hypothetical protein TCAL_16406 [Tigriopus californicus]|uniref:Uncharacterized protein n=1 Tax=Tigriopus californicus TaxID=6832 RepID=A0A553NYA8_TIGCA|nr:hypothetical protein TCAL_16406 [Tigriopus californicus]
MAESCANPKGQATSYTPAARRGLGPYRLHPPNSLLTAPHGANNVNLFADIRRVYARVRSQDGSNTK